jgi:Tfp pilus assembly protein FimT
VIMSIIAMIAIPNSNDHITKAYSCMSSSSTANTASLHGVFNRLCAR